MLEKGACFALLVTFVCHIQPVSSYNIWSSILRGHASLTLRPRFCFATSHLQLCFRRPRPLVDPIVLHVGGQGSDMVTYGDIWRTAMNEPELRIDEENLLPTVSSGTAGTSVQEESRPADSVSSSATILPVGTVAKAATFVGAAANIWSSLTKGPSDEEVHTFMRSTIMYFLEPISYSGQTMTAPGKPATLGQSSRRSSSPAA